MYVFSELQLPEEEATVPCVKNKILLLELIALLSLF
jgi:hypothetical protein